MKKSDKAITVDLAEVRTLLEDALDRIDKVDGEVVLNAQPRRDRSAQLAVIGKELLFLSHLCDKARIAALDEYHSSRGFDAA